jgi:spermidine synthase
MKFGGAEIIERFATPRGDIQLQRRGMHYEIISNGTFVMATYNGESEKKLVRAALDARETERCSVLIGGLGVGFSLAEAVRSPRTRRVTVVEIGPQIIRWNRTFLAAFSDRALEDEKTEIVHADLIRWISDTEETFDVVCLDIDNGPDWTVFRENDVLYDDDGLTRLVRLLNPGRNGCAPVFARSGRRRSIIFAAENRISCMWQSFDLSAAPFRNF